MKRQTKLSIVIIAVFIGIPSLMAAGPAWRGYVLRQALLAQESQQAMNETKMPPDKVVSTAAQAKEPDAALLDPLVVRNPGDFTSVVVDEEERLCMGNIIYGEARNESLVGMIGVGLVLRYRSLDNRTDFGLGGICSAAFMQSLRKDGSITWQFDGAKILPSIKESKAWRKSMMLAGAILRGEYSFSPSGIHIRYFYAINPRAYKNKHGVGKGWLVRCTDVVAAPDGHAFSQENGKCDQRQPAIVVAKVHHKPTKPAVQVAHKPAHSKLASAR